MSQGNRKFKRVSALFPKVQPVAPDSPFQDAGESSADDPTGRLEQTPAQPSAEYSHPESAVPPAEAPAAGGRQDFTHGIDRVRKMGFTYDQGKVTSLEETPPPLPDDALCVPQMVSGTTILTIHGAGDEAGWTAQEIETVGAVAAQLARHIENLNALE